jgi:hypothetical protein
VPCKAKGVYDVVVSAEGVFEHVVDAPDAVDGVDMPALIEVVGGA